jgi:hypothetical protein
MFLGMVLRWMSVNSTFVTFIVFQLQMVKSRLSGPCAGLNVEGILRQAADVQEVEKRVREFEQGNMQFGPDEDAHVIADCVKVG